MRFLKPNRTPDEAEGSAEFSRVEAGNRAAGSSGVTIPGAETVASDEQRDRPRHSEGARILLERIDALTSRLSACEDVIEQMMQQASVLDARHADQNRDIEERLRRQVERQVAGLSVEMERRQKEFASKQARLLELLASEINKVRSIAEAGTEPHQVVPPGGRG